MPQPVHLEPEAKAFADAAANPPYLFDLGPEKGRKAVDEVQSAPVDKPDVDTRRVPAATVTRPGRGATCRSASCGPGASPGRCP